MMSYRLNILVSQFLTFSQRPPITAHDTQKKSAHKIL